VYKEKLIFVADLFADQYVGGAELTTEALLEQNDKFEFIKINSNLVDIKFIDLHKKNKWIFGNYNNLDSLCMFKIMKETSYYIIEYDYKFCKIRNPTLHSLIEGSCVCETTEKGKLISMFMKNSKMNFFMSEKQRNIYLSRFSYLNEKNTTILSSVFRQQDLDYIKNIQKIKNNKWIIFNSQHPLKGTKQSIEYANLNKLNYELISNLSHKEVLNKLSSSKGLIFLPIGEDTCPRLVIEAKLLDCEIVSNDNVQHREENWFLQKETAFEYLEKRIDFFWSKINESL
jgi:hypothetical protein